MFTGIPRHYGKVNNNVEIYRERDSVGTDEPMYVDSIDKAIFSYPPVISNETLP